MNSSLHLENPVSTRPTPSPLRRTALVAAGALALVIPTMFTITITRMLLTGAEDDHRFHQLTGQGLLLCALWLVPLVGLVRAGWSGRRPSTAAGVQHLAVVATGAVCALIAPGGGAPALMTVIAIPGALLWLALPRRPRLRVPVRLDPVLAPAALLASAVLVPYAIAQLRLQNATGTGYHAENPHYFDMAWIAGVLVVLGLCAALLPTARRLGGWLGAGCTFVGAAGLLLGEPSGWALAQVTVGVLVLGSTVARGRMPDPADPAV
ncbi:hypothetical protein FHP29_00605 [Nocardioides albidus]|uniref:Uncharacterized protein n=1 Tax=Nocardioides albidus TaxID=1517589 RepID=A0A5C4WQ17_9ACTN|nr:hypothetical protein [Nocardioides albidus]TNM50261.1 hypothetical protein FHP29_00605 [Nocardioides albidus]